MEPRAGQCKLFAIIIQSGVNLVSTEEIKKKDRKIDVSPRENVIIIGGRGDAWENCSASATASSSSPATSRVSHSTVTAYPYLGEGRGGERRIFWRKARAVLTRWSLGIYITPIKAYSSVRIIHAAKVTNTRTSSSAVTDTTQPMVDPPFPDLFQHLNARYEGKLEIGWTGIGSTEMLGLNVYNIYIERDIRMKDFYKYIYNNCYQEILSYVNFD